MEKLRVAIVGCGGIANGKHMPSLQKVEECEMVAFCDLDIERAQIAAAESLEIFLEKYPPIQRHSC